MLHEGSSGVPLATTQNNRVVDGGAPLLPSGSIMSTLNHLILLVFTPKLMLVWSIDCNLYYICRVTVHIVSNLNETATISAARRAALNTKQPIRRQHRITTSRYQVKTQPQTSQPCSVCQVTILSSI